MNATGGLATHFWHRFRVLRFFGLDMFTLQHLTAWLALVIASAGPLPLWMHHASSHSHASHEHGADGPVGHSHAGLCHHHHLASDASSHVAQRTTTSEKSADSSGQEETCQRPLGVNAPPDAHDCFICYQLSQAAAAAMVYAPESCSLPPIASGNTLDEISIATICGWHAPRGPPTA